MYPPRPTEPHPDQASFPLDVAPDVSSGWGVPLYNPELCPPSWSQDSGASAGREIRADYMTPSELATWHYGVRLTYDPDTGARPRASYRPRLTEPHPDQLDPSSWEPVDEWLPAGFRDYASGSGGTSDIVGLGRAPQAWRGPAYEWDNEDFFPLDQLATGFLSFGELYVLSLVSGDDPDPDPDPEPDPDATDEALVAAVKRFTGITDDELDGLVLEHVRILSVQVFAYTRGRGFRIDPETSELVPELPLRAVIVSAASRSFPNPTGSGQIRVGDVIANPGTYSGWTLPELAILHNYRRRSA